MGIFEASIGWLAPPQCLGCQAEGSPLCQMCATSEILPFGEKCWSCNSLSVRGKTCAHCRHGGSPNFVWITTDYENISKALISEYKFKHNRSAAKPIANLMVDTFLLFNNDDHIAAKNYVVVSVPTATGRIRQRSFDHAALIAKNVARILELEYQKGLRRYGQVRQTGAKRAERLAKIAGSFTAQPASKLQSRNILLIDDVITTGATIGEAAKTLRKAGARSVDALVFAKRL